MADTSDPGMTLPLAGVQLVEASAGTGKTFALATLYSRGVIEAGLPVSALLAVTFTEAATRELRTRIRERLALAQRLADGAAVDPGDFEQVLTQALVQAALAAGEAPLALRARLRAAAEAMDLAPVFTIHTFCRRALAEHALEAGKAPGEVELVANERALREEVATDLWRIIGSDADDARVLATVWKSPAALADNLRDLWSVDELRPAPAPVDVDAERSLRARLAAAAVAVADGCRDLGDATCAAIRAAIAAGALSAVSHKPERVDRLWPVLQDWAADGCDGDPPDEAVAIFGTTRLAGALKKASAGKVAPPRTALTDAI
jgi:exodeoxyribonuclease V beta subunit